MPSIEKRIKNLNKNVSKLETNTDFNDKIEKYTNYKTEIDTIKKDIELIQKKINSPDNYNDKEENDDNKENINYDEYYKRLEEIRNIIETKELKLEKLVSIYIECYHKFAKCEEKLSKTNIKINEI